MSEDPTPSDKKPRAPRETLSVKLTVEASAAVRRIASRFDMTQSGVLGLLEEALDHPARAYLTNLFTTEKAKQDAEALFGQATPEPVDAPIEE